MANGNGIEIFERLNLNPSIKESINQSINQSLS